MTSFFTELKRRNVFKVAVAYGIVAWLLMQVADTAAPALNLPDWTVSFITLLLLLGFPLAMFLVWAYEMTPEGIKAAADVQPTESITQVTGQKLNYAILGLVVLAVGFLVVDRFVLNSGVNTASVGQPVGAASEMGGPSSAAPATSSVEVERYPVNLGVTAPMGSTAALDAEVELSPDGSRFVYSADVDGSGVQLYMRARDQIDAQPIPGTEGGRKPFFSPDGQWIGFDANNGSTLKKVSVRGGPPQTLVAEGLSGTRGISWGTDGTIILSTTAGLGGVGGRLVQVPENGGVLEVLLESESGSTYRWPQYLPDGESVLFTISEDSGPTSDGSIAILSRETGEYRTILAGGYNARYAPTGHIVFIREEALWAVPFDLERLEITGTETPIVEGVQVNIQGGDAIYAFSDDGLLVYARGGDTSTTMIDSRTLVWVDRDGSETPFAVDPHDYMSPRLSPDGQRLAVSIQDNFNRDVWIYDLVRGTSSRLTFGISNDQRPIWTPDGESVVYYSFSGEGGLVKRAANGTGERQWLTMDLSNTQNAETFTPDGSQLVFRQNIEGNTGLFILSMEGGADPEPLLVEDKYDVFRSAISPDGRWMAYSSEETGEVEVYVRPFPNIDDGKWQVSTNGGSTPRWGPDGTELFFTSEVDDEIAVMVADVESEPSFNVTGIPRVLFKGDFQDGGRTSPNYDVGPDGQRFILMKPVGQDDPISRLTSVVFVRNWFEELKRLAPPDSP